MTHLNKKDIINLLPHREPMLLIDELYDIIGDKCTMIDFGSIWDPFVGKTTRSYHKEYKTINF